MALELENERKEKNKLKDELEELKRNKVILIIKFIHLDNIYKMKDNELIKSMNDEIITLKNELKISERLITELKFTSQFNHNRFDQLDSLRSENYGLKEKVKHFELLSAQQNQQVIESKIKF